MIKQIIAAAVIASTWFQSAGAAAYDYDFSATVFADGEFYGTRRGNDNGPRVLNSYYTVLSDKPLSDSGEMQPGGTYYAFDLYGAAPTDNERLLPPAGIYNWAKAPAMNVLLNNSKVYVLDGNGNREVDREFTGGSMTVSMTEKDGNSYINYDATLTDDKGYTHHVTYSSRFVEYADESQGPGYLEKDLDVRPVYAKGRFMELDEDGVMQMQFTFSEIPDLEDGGLDLSGLPLTTIYLQAYINYDKEGIVNGVYEITPDYGPAGTLADGDIVQVAGVEYAVGSYAEYINYGSTVHWGVFGSGKLTVSGEGDSRLYEAEFVTKDGFNVKMRYQGNLILSRMPDTDLTENVVLNLEGARCEARYFGDTYRESGSTWLLDFIAADEGGDSWMSELVSKGRGFWNGIVSDVYTAAPNNNLWTRNYKRGQRINDVLVGTWYKGDFDSDGVPHVLAPAVEGDLVVTNHNDGTYTFKFCFEDGMNHTWSGEWTGKPELTNMTDEPGVALDTVRSDDGVGVATDGDGIVFGAAVDYVVTDVAGRIVARGHGDRANLPAHGIYLVSVNRNNLKIVF